MRRWISALLCLCMLVALAACAEGGAQTTVAEEGSFRVGYSKVNITPSQPMVLEGYGSVGDKERFHEQVLDYIYLTCVAISDQKDNTVLMYSVDVVNIVETVITNMKVSVSEATGIPKENLFFTATHTHSAPKSVDLGSQLKKAAVQAAEEALEERKPAQMYFGTANTDRISFVRHYYDVNGKSVTDNHGDDKAELTGHTTEIDQEMRVLQFKREGGKDVILANWQCHPHMTGGSAKYDISADIVGMMRMYMEQDLDCLFAYYQGGAGNINPTSRIKTEEVNTKKDYKMTGQLMANAAKIALKDMTEIKTGEIKVQTEAYTCNSNREEMEKIVAAAEILGYHREGGGRPAGETQAYAESLNVGIYSYYHAANIAGRFDKPETFDVSLGTIAIGDFAWSTMPGEYFDTTVKYIRDNSPYTYNFVSPYTNGSPGYFPSLEAWEYGCYEADTSPAARGTAESVADRLLEMLNTLHGK